MSLSDRRVIVTSASPPNGDGYGAALGFDLGGHFIGIFSGDARIADPRGLCVDPDGALLYLNSGTDRVLALNANGDVVHDSGIIPGLNPGGAILGPDGRLYVGLRTERSIVALPPNLAGTPERILPAGVVPFPRGFAFAADGRLFLASGIGPTGEGENTIVAFSSTLAVLERRFVNDPDLSPLDLLIAPNGDVVVASEHPFGATDAVTTIRQYKASTGGLVRVLHSNDRVQFRRPRGLRFAPDGNLYCVCEDDIVGFDFETGACLGALVSYPRLNGMALEFF
jgi:DNA-binding beta-propeller fold protein YncE